MTDASTASTPGMGIAYRQAVSAQDLAACFQIMAAFRPKLESEADWIAQAIQLASSGYRVLAAWDGLEVIAIAGYRTITNLFHGRFLYVDDLVTSKTRRSEGHGARLLDELAQIGNGEGCASIVLDTGVTNTAAQRFYHGQGFVHYAVGFIKPLPS